MALSSSQHMVKAKFGTDHRGEIKIDSLGVSIQTDGTSYDNLKKELLGYRRNAPFTDGSEIYLTSQARFQVQSS